MRSASRSERRAEAGRRPRRSPADQPRIRLPDQHQDNSCGQHLAEVSGCGEMVVKPAVGHEEHWPRAKSSGRAPVHVEIRPRRRDSGRARSSAFGARQRPGRPMRDRGKVVGDRREFERKLAGKYGMPRPPPRLRRTHWSGAFCASATASSYALCMRFADRLGGTRFCEPPKMWNPSKPSSRSVISRAPPAPVRRRSELPRSAAHFHARTILSSKSGFTRTATRASATSVVFAIASSTRSSRNDSIADQDARRDGTRQFGLALPRPGKTDVERIRACREAQPRAPPRGHVEAI